MAKTDLPVCSTCRWFRPLRLHDERGDGECMLAPPVALQPAIEAKVRYHRPLVRDGDYCASHQEAVQ